MEGAAAARATCTELTNAKLPLLSRLLGAYPASLQSQVGELLAGKGEALAGVLLRKYPQMHRVRSDKALFDYVADLKARYLRSTPPLHKVLFDNKLHVLRHALGLHVSTARVQGNRLSTRREIRIASLFRQVPEDFLHMIVVHELAHLRESEHDKAFYQLCEHMEPRYHQLEFDLRTYLVYCEHSGKRLWMQDTPEKIADNA